MTEVTNASRRKFLLGLAKTGMLLPFAGQLLGQNAFAQTGGAQRVLFIYYPNGVHPATWRPQQDSGSISNGSELSWGLGPLSNWHDRMIVLKNLYCNIGEGAGAHTNDMRGILTGDNAISASNASIDHLIAEQLGDEGVLNLGVRTGTDGGMIVSKARNKDTASRDIPNNDPYDVAQKLAMRIGGGGNGGDSELKRQMYEAILSDFDRLANATLDASRQAKLDMHISALTRLRDQAGAQVGECAFSTSVISDPAADATGTLTQEEYAMFPHIARAQVDNIVGAFACGLHRVATLQVSKGDENGGLVHHGWDDECWQMAQVGLEQGLQWDDGSGLKPVESVPRNYNEFTSHNASHKPNLVSHHVQVRWYHSLVAYTLEQLSARALLDDTLVVLFSEVGDGSKHGGGAGSVTVAGGAGGSLQMGRIITCGDGITNGNSTWGSHHLFGDIARLTGVTVPSLYWKTGLLT
jgi:hypothetical protein